MTDAGKYLSRWFKHFALNLGFLLSTLVFMWLPPQWHHDRADYEGFDWGSAWRWFLDGLGFPRKEL